MNCIAERIINNLFRYRLLVTISPCALQACQAPPGGLPSALIQCGNSKENTVGYNLAELSKEEMDKVNVDLAASGVAFKERYNMPVIPEMVEREQPEHLRDYFRERVAHYRAESHKYSRLPYEPKSK
jgi:DNA polymerase-3 subunit theta